MRDSINAELFYIQYTDSLTCVACGRVIYSPQTHARLDVKNERYTYKYSDVTEAYHDHARECFALRRLLVSLRLCK